MDSFVTMAHSALIGISKDCCRYSLKLPASKDFDRNALNNAESKSNVNDLINKAVLACNKRSHAKYPMPDIVSLHELLVQHPCPLGQGPVICQIDSEYDEPGVNTPTWHTGEKAIITNTLFRHDETQQCVNWTAVETSVLNANYVVTDFDIEQHPIQGAASKRDMSIVYTCQFAKCRINCNCSICMDKSENCRLVCRLEICSNCACQCIKHEIKLARLFDPEIDQFTLITNIIVSYRYAVPHTGIPRNCTACTQDILEHQMLHLVFHLRCKFCRQAARPLQNNDVLTVGDFDEKEKEINWHDDRTCSICLKKLSDKFVRIKHESTVHNNNPKTLKCSQCDKTYMYKNALNHHMAVTHKVSDQKFTCEKCGDQFLSKVTLTDHRKLIHEKSPGISCEECEKTFSVNHSLQRHMREVHRYLNYNLDYIEDLDSIGIKCNVCEKVFKRKSEMLRHLRTTHKNLAEETLGVNPSNVSNA